MINRGLKGCAVLAVLIGRETYTRRWVDYEILKSIEFGMGVLGIRIHQIPDPKTGTDVSGSNPFEFLGYGEKGGQLRPMIRYKDGWRDAPYQSLISHISAPLYLAGKDKPVLHSILSVYDWEDDDGYHNFGDWVDAAAAQAGR
jgi:hypothetical protein